MLNNFSMVYSDAQKEPTGPIEVQEGLDSEEKSVTTQVTVSEVAKESPQERAVITEVTVSEVARESAQEKVVITEVTASEVAQEVAVQCSVCQYTTPECELRFAVRIH